MKQAIIKTFTRIMYAVSAIIVVGFALYWAAFYIGAPRAVNHITQNLTTRGYIITAHRKFSGFPIRPRITGSLHVVTPDNQVVIQIPNFEIRGFFIPYTAVQIHMPLGMALSGPGTDEMWPEWKTIKAASINFNMPPQIYADMPATAINGLDMQVDQSRIMGAGTMRLNANMQPEIAMNMRIVNATRMITQLKRNGVIDADQAAIISMFLRSFEFHDPETNTFAVSVPISIINQWVYAGPIMLWQIPTIDIGL